MSGPRPYWADQEAHEAARELAQLDAEMTATREQILADLARDMDAAAAELRAKWGQQ